MFPPPLGSPSIRFSLEVSWLQECQATCGRKKTHRDAKLGHDFVWPIRHLFPRNSAPLRIDKKSFLDPRFAPSTQTYGLVACVRHVPAYSHGTHILNVYAPIFAVWRSLPRFRQCAVYRIIANTDSCEIANCDLSRYSRYRYNGHYDEGTHQTGATGAGVEPSGAGAAHARHSTLGGGMGVGAQGAQHEEPSALGETARRGVRMAIHRTRRDAPAAHPLRIRSGARR